MSLANTRSSTVPTGRTVDVFRCEHCQGHYPHSGRHKYGYDRRFCTWQCKYRSKADSVLDTVKYDHQYCFSCFRRLKEVTAPTLTKKSAERGKSIPDFVTGRQQYFDHARQDLQNTNRRGESVHEYGSATLESRMTCCCPANHHTTVHELPDDVEWTKRELIAHTKRLVDALDELDDRGKLRTDFVTDALFDYVRAEKSRQANQGRDDRAVLRDGLAHAIREHP